MDSWKRGWRQNEGWSPQREQRTASLSWSELSAQLRPQHLQPPQSRPQLCHHRQGDSQDQILQAPAPFPRAGLARNTQCNCRQQSKLLGMIWNESSRNNERSVPPATVTAPVTLPKSQSSSMETSGRPRAFPAHTALTKSCLFLQAGAGGQHKFLSRRVEFSGPSGSSTTPLEQQVAVQHGTARSC